MSAENTRGKFLASWLRQAFRRFVRSTADKGHMEIERKFTQTPEEAQALPVRLKELGFIYVGTATMDDTFLPGALPGEMMRVRRERIGNGPTKTLFTFKQWVETPQGKKRQETEREVKPTAALVWLLLGRWIEGRSLDGFGKQRGLFEGKLNGTHCVVSIDDVTGLGRYSGSYLEVEVLLPVDADFAPYETAILNLVEKLYGSPRQPFDKSYMALLAESKVS